MPYINISDLSLGQIISGAGSLIFAILSIILGLRILINYFTVKRKEFISVGLSWIFLSSAWWGGGFCFLSILLFQYAFEQQLYLFLAITFIPFALISWTYSVYNLFLKDTLGLKKDTLLYVFIICCLIYWGLIIILLFYDYNLVGSYVIFQTRPALLAAIFDLIAIVFALITGLIFASQSMRADDKTLVWKGRFLSTGFILFTIGTFLEVLLTLNPIGLVIVRIILITSAIAYFLGFLLPTPLEKKLIKED